MSGKPQKEKKEKIEREYERLFTYQPPAQVTTEQQSLEQPHTGQTITTVTTYAAYEEPI